MSDIENNTLILQNTIHTETSDKAMLTLSALVGIIGAAAMGMNMSGLQAENIPQLAAIAVPGVVAWVISYLINNPDVSDRFSESIGSGMAASAKGV